MLASKLKLSTFRLILKCVNDDDVQLLDFRAKKEKITQKVLSDLKV
jgi:hypothetical protein